MSAINFNKLHPEIDHDISGTKYSELGDINGIPAAEFISKIKEEFDSHPVEELIKTPTESIKAFTEYVRGKFPVKVLTGISSSYPFVVPKMTTYTQDLIDFLVNTTSSVNKPEDFLYWITRGLFPSSWNNSSSSINDATLRCISKVKVEGNDSQHLYAAITVKNEFFIYDVDGDKTKVSFKCKYAKLNCIAEENKVEIFSDANGQPAKVFTVEVTTALKMWENAFAENAAPFPFYINFPEEKKFPELVVVAVYHGLTAADKFYIKSLTDKSINYNSPDIYHALIDVFAYANRMPDFIEAVVSHAIEGSDASYKDLFNEAHTAKLFEALCLSYTNKYYTGFGRKLVGYINERSSEIESEKVFFTIVKYIMSSVGEVPEQLRLFLGIVSKYCDVRFNKQKTTAKAVLGLFFEFVLRPLLVNPTAYFSDFEVKDAEAFSKATGLLGKLFAFDKIGSGDLDRRRKAHTKKQLISFAYSLTVNENPAFTQCNVDHLEDSISAIIQAITEDASFKKHYIDAAEDFHACGLSYNLASVIGSFFVHGQDEVETKAEVPPPVEAAPVKAEEKSESSSSSSSKKKKEKEEEVKKEEEEVKKEEEEVKKEEEKKPEEGGEEKKKRRRKEKKDDEKKEEEKKEEEKKPEEGGEKKRHRKEKKPDEAAEQKEEKKPEEGGEKKRRKHKKEE